MIWFLTIVFVIFDAYFNRLRISNGNKINHVWNTIYRIVFYGLLVYLYRMPYLQILMFLLGAFFLAWILFNLVLNFLQEKSLDYLGTASLLDRLERKLPWIVWLVWKVIAASGFIYGYYHTELL